MRIVALGLAAALLGSTALAQTPSTTTPGASPNGSAPAGTGASAPASTDNRRSTSAPDTTRPAEGGARAETRDNRSGTTETRRESTRVGVEVRDRPGVEVSRTRVRTYESQPEVVERRRSVRSVEVQENAAPTVQRAYVSKKKVIKRVAKKKRGTRYVVKSRRSVAVPATVRRTTVRSYEEPSTTTIRSRSVRTIDRDRVSVGTRERAGVSVDINTRTRRDTTTGDVNAGARRAGAGDAASTRPSGNDTGAARSPSTGSGSNAPATGASAPASGGAPASSGTTAPTTR